MRFLTFVWIDQVELAALTGIRVCVFKETVQRDFAPSVFHQSNPGAKIFSIVANISLG